MDVERTMQFILETQARTTATLEDLAERQRKAELRMDRSEQRMDRSEQRMDRFEQKMDRFDRSLNGIRKLIQTGMKLMVQNQQGLKELRLSQKATDKRLNAFLASMEKGRNGRGHN